MKSFWALVPLLALLIVAIWFASQAWSRVSEAVPPAGWLAIAGGVFFSLLVGGGLMALVFYSARHGYDDPADRRDE